MPRFTVLVFSDCFILFSLFLSGEERGRVNLFKGRHGVREGWGGGLILSLVLGD